MAYAQKEFLLHIKIRVANYADILKGNEDKIIQSQICTLKVVANRQEFDALDLNSRIVFSIESKEEIDLSKIGKGKTSIYA